MNTGSEIRGPADDRGALSTISSQGVEVFDLHDPGLMSHWSTFLATTPMLNDQLLPPSLQDRLKNVVATYRFLTPADRPAFFVATYFDLLSERLLAVHADDGSEILPMRVCPVFTSGADASVTSLLAVASGLPDELFVNAPGRPERYRYLFLQTEFSHCRFLGAIRAAAESRRPGPAGRHAETGSAILSFTVGARRFNAVLSSKEEFRALLETVGEVDAVTTFREQMPRRRAVDEAEVLCFIRLLSLLATDGRSGYAAIPVLFPLLSAVGADGHTAEAESLLIVDALELAFEVRDVFRQIVPFEIRSLGELLNAKLAVSQALEDGAHQEEDVRVTALLEQFVAGSDLLLATTIAQEKMPLTKD
jgi:hypothetical protein